MALLLESKVEDTRGAVDELETVSASSQISFAWAANVKVRMLRAIRME